MTAILQFYLDAVRDGVIEDIVIDREPWDLDPAWPEYLNCTDIVKQERLYRLFSEKYSYIEPVIKKFWWVKK